MAKFVHFVSRPLSDARQKREILKALKLQKLEKANFSPFLKLPTLVKNYPKNCADSIFVKSSRNQVLERKFKIMLLKLMSTPLKNSFIALYRATILGNRLVPLHCKWLMVLVMIFARGHSWTTFHQFLACPFSLALSKEEFLLRNKT